MKTISILGCGWLGKALADALLKKGYAVNGSVRSEKKRDALKAIGITPYVLQVENTEILGDFKSFLSAADIIITAFPPGIRRNPNANYAARIKQVLASLPSHSNCKCLHLSSIGVFGATQGEVNESTKPEPDRNVGTQLLEAEKAVIAFDTNATIVRLGGLVGNARHPVKQLACKTGLASAMAPTNLVHQIDVIAFLLAVIDKNLWGQTFHCVSPLHQLRGEFYTQECIENGLPLPQFLSGKSNRSKKVLDTKSAEVFGFKYQLARCRFKDC